MLHPIEEYFEQLEEPVKSSFLSLRKIILNFDSNISEHWKYRIPFYYYKGRMFCYLYQQKKKSQTYIGFAKGDQMEHYTLDRGDRKKMKVMHFKPEEDLPIDTIYELMEMARKLY
jgi:hypothetical protein